MRSYEKRAKMLTDADIANTDPEIYIKECADVWKHLRRKKHAPMVDALFLKCHAALCKWTLEGKITIYAGECDFEYLKTLLENDGPEYAAFILFTSNGTDFYRASVCVRGMPMIERVKQGGKACRRDLAYLAECMRPIGTYFADFVPDAFLMTLKRLAKEGFEALMLFLSEAERDGAVVLYAGTYSLEEAIERAWRYDNASFYIYTTKDKRGYHVYLNRMGCGVRTDHKIFDIMHRRLYGKRYLSNCYMGEEDFRRGEYFSRKAR